MTPPTIDRIAVHLPYLRRYARALMRDQNAGDELVRAAVAHLLDGASSLQTAAERVAMFAALHEVIKDRGHPVAAALDTQLLLLTSLEGLSIAEAALVVQVDEGEASSQLDAARRSLLASLRARVLVIEDDPIIALDICELLKKAGHEVVGVAASEEHAVRIAEDERPDLVLADINLGAGGDGASAVERILARSPCPVVFVTAFPERALTGERREPIYVIAKPFNPMTLAVTTFQAMGGSAHLTRSLSH